MSNSTNYDQIEAVPSTTLPMIYVALMRRSLLFTPAARARISAIVDFSDQITKIYHQGARAAQLTFEQPRGRHHTFEHRDEMRRD